MEPSTARSLPLPDLPTPALNRHARRKAAAERKHQARADTKVRERRARREAARAGVRKVLGVVPLLAGIGKATSGLAGAFQDLADTIQAMLASFRLPTEMLGGNGSLANAKVAQRVFEAKLGWSEADKLRYDRIHQEGGFEAVRKQLKVDLATARQLDHDRFLFGNAFYEETPDGSKRRAPPLLVKRLPSGRFVIEDTDTEVVQVKDVQPPTRYGTPAWVPMLLPKEQCRVLPMSQSAPDTLPACPSPTPARS